MSPSPVILMRTALAHEREERAAAAAHFPVVALRTAVPMGSVVVGRYANLPFHFELEQDLHNLGSRMVNTTAQHRYVADFEYYEDLQDVTFATWFDPMHIPRAVRENEAFVVKGRTNSIKQAWSQLMFAQDFAQANRVAAALRADGLIGPQGVVYRQFVSLETFETSAVSGMPFSNEWRIFYFQGQRLAHGYYWSGIDDWSAVERATPNFVSEGLPFADAVAKRLVDKIPFVVVDVARTQAGRWMVVELNDGCQAGLNDSVPADMLYSNLRRAMA